jgi:hypothetical protein
MDAFRQESTTGIVNSRKIQNVPRILDKLLKLAANKLCNYSTQMNLQKAQSIASNQSQKLSKICGTSCNTIV